MTQHDGTRTFMVIALILTVLFAGVVNNVEPIHVLAVLFLVIAGATAWALNTRSQNAP